ncbi:MAG TPA: hypothetical protein EYN26_06410 [Chromatiales bacterium]|nr:hypothetical protein [Chromatiaceae bacterium]HIO54758.1 hypothetical protein [Chromatiales bacterium]
MTTATSVKTVEVITKPAISSPVVAARSVLPAYRSRFGIPPGGVRVYPVVAGREPYRSRFGTPTQFADFTRFTEPTQLAYGMIERDPLSHAGVKRN